MAGQRSTGLAAALAVAALFALTAPAFIGPAAPGSASSRAGAVGAALRGGAAPAPLPEVRDAPAPLKLGGAVLSMLAALVVAFVPLAEAQAAKSGGRMGSSMPARQAPPPKPAPSKPAPAPSSSTTTVNKTVVNKTVVVQQPAPVMMAPPVVAGPSMGEMIVGNVVGNVAGNMISNAMLGGSNRGPSNTDRMLEQQQRQDERQMDKQQMDLEALRRDVQDMKIAAAAKS